MSRKRSGGQRSVVLLGTRGYPSYYGGFETAVRKLAPSLVDSGWDVAVYGRPGQTKSDDQSIDRRVRRIETRGIESKKFSTLSFGLSSAIHAAVRRPDVAIVMNCANGLWLPILRLAGVKTAVNVDGMEWERAKWGRVAKLVFRLGAYFTARFANVIICDADAIADRWRKEFKRDSVVIAYGGDVEPSRDVPLGLSRRGYALWVARLVPENSFDEFISAVDAVSQKYPVVIVGSSGYADDYDRKVRKAADHPNVTALGHVSDDSLLHALWEHSGAYFHGHSVGGTNPALVQAMASGAPIVARETVFNREVLGDTAVFVAPDSAEIASTLLRMLDSPETADAMGNEAKARAVAHYSWSDICSKYATVAESLLRK